MREGGIVSDPHDNRRVSRAGTGRPLTLTVDGERVEAYAGETVAAALLACGCRTFRWTDGHHAPRGLFCGMGVCFDCLVTVNGQPNVRACMTSVEEGMVVETRGYADE
jgi:predicted molibdopterin-dependent oxidoreductase YjgC